MKARPALAPAGWRAAYALMMMLYIECYAWLPRLVGWLFGAPVSLPLGWPFELGLGVLVFLIWFFIAPRPTRAQSQKATPHSLVLLVSIGIGGFVAVTGVFLPDDLPPSARFPAALTLGIGMALVVVANLYAGDALRRRATVQVAPQPGVDRPAA